MVEVNNRTYKCYTYQVNLCEQTITVKLHQSIQLCLQAANVQCLLEFKQLKLKETFYKCYICVCYCFDHCNFKYCIQLKVLMYL